MKTHHSHQINASSAGPSFVPVAITPDPVLEKKTAVVVLEELGGAFRASVYRESSKVCGSWTRDKYVWRSGGWKYDGKDRRKYSVPPLAPIGSETFWVGSVQIWTRTKVSAEERRRIEALVKRPGLI